MRPNEHLRSLFKTPANTSLPCLLTDNNSKQIMLTSLTNPHANINIRLDLLEKYLNLNPSVSKHVILPRLVADLGGLNALLKDNDAKRDTVELDEYQKMTQEVSELLKRSKQIDEANVGVYYEQVEAKLDQCVKQKQNFSQVAFVNSVKRFLCVVLNFFN